MRSIFGKKPDATPASQGAPAKKQEGPWIGVDLDGTLAEWTRWRGLNHIGAPIPAMQQRVQEWLEAGYNVKIVTARASVEGGVKPVKSWLAKHGLPELEVTNAKDFNMLELWDDRAVQVIANTGKPVIHPSMNARPKAPLFVEEQAGDTFELARLREGTETEEEENKGD